LLSCMTGEAFMAPGSHLPAARMASQSLQKSTALQMGLDMVTYMRVEWISAAIVTNQTPETATVCLQLGCEDGRAVTFIPKTIEELITSTVEPDGVLPVTVRRQLAQQKQGRVFSAKITYADQRADDLKETEDESVDVVISLQAAARMIEKGLDWKKSVQEAARVLKPGGRLLFVEQPDLDGESYLDYLANLCTPSGDEDDDELFPVFEPVGYDDVDLVLIPHVAGIVIKSEEAGLSATERESKEKNAEKDRMAEISILAYERGIKKRKRKKKKTEDTEEAEA
jgi:SAM-dependent methyltransferase